MRLHALTAYVDPLKGLRRCSSWSTGFISSARASTSKAFQDSERNASRRLSSAKLWDSLQGVSEALTELPYVRPAAASMLLLEAVRSILMQHSPYAFSFIWPCSSEGLKHSYGKQRPTLPGGRGLHQQSPPQGSRQSAAASKVDECNLLAFT